MVGPGYDGGHNVNVVRDDPDNTCNITTADGISLLIDLTVVELEPTDELVRRFPGDEASTAIATTNQHASGASVVQSIRSRTGCRRALCNEIQVVVIIYPNHHSFTQKIHPCSQWEYLRMVRTVAKWYVSVRHRRYTVIAPTAGGCSLMDLKTASGNRTSLPRSICIQQDS